MLRQKLHRRIEKAFKLKKGSLKTPIESLKVRHKFEDSDVLRIADECADYCIENKNDFEVAFNLYVSCLNNPNKEKIYEKISNINIDNVAANIRGSEDK